MAGQLWKSSCLLATENPKTLQICVNTIFAHRRPAGIIFLKDLQLRVLLDITKSVPVAGIIRNADVIEGRALYEEIG